MPLIRFSHNMQGWPIERQTPGGSGSWEEFVFVGRDDPAAAEPDYWFVYEGLTETEEAVVAPGRVIFVTAEPEAKRWYDPRFLAQFGLIVGSQPRIEGVNVVHSQPALPWHAGVRRRKGQGGTADADEPTLGYDDFRRLRPEKRRDLSVVCTDKAGVEGQRKRLAFVERLLDHFGERLDWYGRGVRPIADKWDAIAPYRFHLVLENTVERDYWSEKLSDAYLGLAFPLYWGCPNVGDYFDSDAFEPIDVDRPEQAIERIEQLLAEGLTEARLRALLRAREQVLDSYNLYPTMTALLARCTDGPPQRVQLRPAAAFARRSPVWRRAAARGLRALRSVPGRDR